MNTKTFLGVCAFSFLTVSSLKASDAVGFLSKAATTLTITGTVYPDTPESTTIYTDLVNIITQNGAAPVETVAELLFTEGSLPPDNDLFPAYSLTITINSAITIGPIFCAKQTGTNHIIKLPDGYASLDTGDTVFTQGADYPEYSFTIDISGLLFENTSNNLTSNIAISGNDVATSLLESVEFRGDKIALIAADARVREYDFSLVGVTGANLKKLCREIAHSVSDRKVTLSGTAAGKVTMQLEID